MKSITKFSLTIFVFVIMIIMTTFVYATSSIDYINNLDNVTIDTDAVPYTYINNGIIFNGVSTYIDTGFKPNSSGVTGLSIRVIMQVDNTDGVQNLAVVRGSGTELFFFQVNNGKLLFDAQKSNNFGGSVNNATSTGLKDYVGVVDTITDNIYVYENGYLSNSTLWSTLNLKDVDSQNLFIGAISGTSTKLVNGTIYRVELYDYPLNNHSIKILNNEYKSNNINHTLRIPQLTYHSIVTGVPATDEEVNVINFTEQMDFLYENNFNAITFKDYYSFIDDNIPLPDNPIIISFDDNRYSVYDIAYPILQERGFVGVWNVVTNTTPHLIYNEKFNETLFLMLEDVFANGWEIASHSHNHFKMTNSSYTYNDRVVEYNASLNALNDLDFDVKTFTYPYNGQNQGNRTECLVFYRGCTGTSVYTGSLGGTYIYVGDSMVTRGLVRIKISPTANMRRFISFVMPDYGLIYYTDFGNKNSTMTYNKLDGTQGLIVNGVLTEGTYTPAYIYSDIENAKNTNAYFPKYRYINATKKFFSEEILINRGNYIFNWLGIGKKNITVHNDNYNLFVSSPNSIFRNNQSLPIYTDHEGQINLTLGSGERAFVFSNYAGQPYPTSIATGITNINQYSWDTQFLTWEQSGTGSTTLTDMLYVNGYPNVYNLYVDGVLTVQNIYEDNYIVTGEHVFYFADDLPMPDVCYSAFSGFSKVATMLPLFVTVLVLIIVFPLIFFMAYGDKDKMSMVVGETNNSMIMLVLGVGISILVIIFVFVLMAGISNTACF